MRPRTFLFALTAYGLLLHPLGAIFSALLFRTPDLRTLLAQTKQSYVFVSTFALIPLWTYGLCTVLLARVGRQSLPWRLALLGSGITLLLLSLAVQVETWRTLASSSTAALLFVFGPFVAGVLAVGVGMLLFLLGWVAKLARAVWGSAPRA
jgi:hypothetical protein